MLKNIKKILLGESGQSFMEYGLLAALVVLAAVVAYQTLGQKISSKIQNVNNNLN
ncbi:MAG: Flp family type IVb pilin [Caldanaerobacter sp.]